jgi:hypothetical protein
MPRNYARAGLAVAVDALGVAVACAALALAWWLATGAGGRYLEALSDALFFAGGITLTFGALIELFHLEGTRDIRKLLLAPLRLLEKRGLIRSRDGDDEDDERGAGWLLIFLGAALITLSVAALLDHII